MSRSLPAWWHEDPLPSRVLSTSNARLLLNTRPPGWTAPETLRDFRTNSTQLRDCLIKFPDEATAAEMRRAPELMNSWAGVWGKEERRLTEGLGGTYLLQQVQAQGSIFHPNNITVQETMTEHGLCARHWAYCRSCSKIVRQRLPSLHPSLTSTPPAPLVRAADQVHLRRLLCQRHCLQLFNTSCYPMIIRRAWVPDSHCIIPRKAFHHHSFHFQKNSIFTRVILLLITTFKNHV